MTIKVVYCILLLIFIFGMILLFTVIDNMDKSIQKSAAQLVVNTFLIQLPVFISIMMMKRGILHLLDVKFNSKTNKNSTKKIPDVGAIPDVGEIAPVGEMASVGEMRD